MRILMITLLTLMILLQGCKEVVKPKVEEVLTKYDLGDKVTIVCYDYFDKKECPIGTKQMDIDILPIVPNDSRFCFGFVDKNATIPNGMKCYKRDIVK